ncbi:MAG: retropepsin-like aspartic protease family protein [Gammaproteobacteria bacterium]
MRHPPVWYLCLSLLSAVSAAEVSPRLAAIMLFKDKAVISIDGKRRTLAAGDTVDGITLKSADANAAVVAIGNRRVTLRLDGRIGAAFSAAPTEILRLAPGEGGHYFVDGTINGNPVAFMIDTGATKIAVNKNTARRLGLTFRTDGVHGQVETASGRVDAYYVRFDRVKVRSLELRNVDGVVVDGDFPSIALLGQSFLNRLDMRRDGLLLELRER